MSAKDFMPENGFEIISDIHVRCNRCGHVHVFAKELADPDTWTEEANMGTRTEYTFLFDENCEACHSRLTCTIRVSEYPPGDMEGAPSIECKGCSVVDSERPQVEYRDYYGYMESQYTPTIHIPHRSILQPKINIALDNGEAIIVPSGVQDNIYSKGHIQIEIPAQRRLLDILVDETGTIHFDENGAVLADGLKIRNPRATALKLLGKVAEAVIVRNCSDSEEINKRWIDKARRGRSRSEIARQFRAIGTGLHSTRRLYPHKYNPSDSQRDIIWMKDDGQVANIIGSSIVSGLQAGLQVKVSGDGVNYVQRALVNNQYEVPIVYFPINNDFDRIVDNLNRKAQERLIKPVLIGDDFINVKDVDPRSFNYVMEYYPILFALYSGRISADDFVKEAAGIAPIQNAIFASVLEQRASKILLFR